MILGFGVFSIGVTAAISWRMDRVDQEQYPESPNFRSLVYFPWLFKEIVVSNLHVAEVILHPDLPIQPQLVRVNTTQRTDHGHVIHANSITITPGTVSLDVRDGTILVHALTQNTAEGALSGEMDQRVTWLEGGD